MDEATKEPIHTETAGEVEISAYFDVAPTGPLYYTETTRRYTVAGKVCTSRRVLGDELCVTANAMKRMSRWLEQNPVVAAAARQNSEDAPALS